MIWSFERIVDVTMKAPHDLGAECKLVRGTVTARVSHTVVVRADTHFDARQFAAARLGIVDERQSLRGRHTTEEPDVELSWRGTDAGASQGRFLWCRERVDGVLGEWRKL